MVNLDNEAIFQRINDLLITQGKNQVQLTNHLGLHQNTYTEWKGKRSKSYMKYLSGISSFLGVSVDYLIGKTEDPAPAAADRAAPSGDSSAELVEYLEQLRTRPEMRMLFSVTKNATKEDIERAVAIIEALNKHNG